MVDQMMSNETLINIKNFPKDAIAIFGLSFHAENIGDLIEERQSLGSAMPLKGTLSEYEAYQYFKKLNETSPHDGLELLVTRSNNEGKDEEVIENEGKVDEESENEKFLWREFVEITGLHPNSVDSVLKLLKADNVSRSNIREIFDDFSVKKKKKIKRKISKFLNANFGHVGSKDEKSNDLLATENFLYGAAQSFFKKRECYVDPDCNDVWDYRYVVCDKLEDDGSDSIIPLCNPKALSRPHAEAMYEVRKLLFSTLLSPV